jgi:hypothetical protein
MIDPRLTFHMYVLDVLCAGRNAFDGYTPSVPEGERLDFGSGRFLQLEGQGLAAAGRAAFVLVAGGLGERLGYQGALWLWETCCNWAAWVFQEAFCAGLYVEVQLQQAPSAAQAGCVVS